MSLAERVLALAERQTREGGRPFPEQVLERLMAETGAKAGILGRGEEIMARRGDGGLATGRVILPAGRDTFWLELAGGTPLDPAARLAAGMVLESWVVREELKKARFGERRRLWEVESLRAIAEALGGTLEPQRIAEELLWHATALLDARRGEVWLASGVIGEGSGGALGELVAVARVGGEVMSTDEVRALGEGGVVEGGRLAVPIRGRRGGLGLLVLAEREVRGGIAPFSVTDGETVALFASQAAVALENAVLHRQDLHRQRLERELELAREIQRQLLPASFSVPPGYEVLARADSSREVGGDVYDLVSAGQDVLLLIADVAGKGVPAALMAASLHAAVRIMAQGCPAPQDVAARLHAHLLEATPDNKFATVFLACLRPGGELHYVSAGHNPVIVVNRDGGVHTLASTGPPLGLIQGSTFAARRTVLPVGALLVAYTDGFTEAPAPASEDDYGVERLMRYLAAHRHDPLPELVDGAFREVTAFTGGAPPHDDRTLVALRRIAV
jgi:sigma-B regulation protein RsbU (phosphoserine phosphatase)